MSDEHKQVAAMTEGLKKERKDIFVNVSSGMRAS